VYKIDVYWKQKNKVYLLIEKEKRIMMHEWYVEVEFLFMKIVSGKGGGWCTIYEAMC
jgi:hypothetical protein